MFHKTCVSHVKLCAVGCNVFLTVSHGQKSLKAADMGGGECSFVPNTPPGGAILVPGRSGAAFYGKQMTPVILTLFCERLSNHRSLSPVW